MKTTIVGTKFRVGGVEEMAKLRKGARVVLVREADNAHDRNAVAVYSITGSHLGYIPRLVNADLAGALDVGQSFEAIVTDEAIVYGGDVKFAPKITIICNV